MTREELMKIAQADIDLYNKQSHSFSCHRLLDSVFEIVGKFRGRDRFLIGYNWVKARRTHEGRFGSKVLAYGATRKEAAAKLRWGSCAYESLWR